MKTDHGISDQQWFEFLEDLLPEGERSKVQAHLNRCSECRELLDALLAWERVVRQEAKVLISALDLSPEEVDRLAVQVLARIRSGEPGPIRAAGLRFNEGVVLLRALLDPLCGRGAARNAVRLAVRQSCAEGEQAIGLSNWGDFVGHLGQAIGSVYGLPSKTLVERVGGLVALEVR